MTNRKTTAIDYYRRRLAEERALATQSASPAIARIHLEMASHYETLVGLADDPTAKARAADITA